MMSCKIILAIKVIQKKTDKICYIKPFTFYIQEKQNKLIKTFVFRNFLILFLLDFKQTTFFTLSSFKKKSIKHI